MSVSWSIWIWQSTCKNRHVYVWANILAAGVNIDWATSTRYLGVYFESAVRFKCSFSKNEVGFYRSFNAIFGKILRCASEKVVFVLIKAKCLPVLLYGTSRGCPTNAANLQSVQFTMNRVIIKLFGTMSQNYYQEVTILALTL